MRLRPTAIAGIIACAALSLSPAVHAGTYTIDFSSLANQSGQGITSFAVNGFLFINPYEFIVVGPGSPDYTGVVGIEPMGPSWTLEDGTMEPIWSQTGSAFQFLPAGVGGSTTFGLTLTGFTSAIPRWTDEIDGSFTGDYFGVRPGLKSAYVLTFGNTAGTPYQLTSLIIQTGTLVVPEPPGGVLGGIALVLVVLTVRRNRVAWHDSLVTSCRRSRAAGRAHWAERGTRPPRGSCRTPHS